MVGFRSLLNLSSALLFINLSTSKPSVNIGSLLHSFAHFCIPTFLKKVLLKMFCKPSDEVKVVIKTEVRCLYWAVLVLRIFVPILGTNPV